MATPQRYLSDGTWASKSGRRSGLPYRGPAPQG